jgi:hypothetical protein
MPVGKHISRDNHLFPHHPFDKKGPAFQPGSDVIDYNAFLSYHKEEKSFPFRSV